MDIAPCPNMCVLAPGHVIPELEFKVIRPMFPSPRCKLYFAVPACQYVSAKAALDAEGPPSPSPTSGLVVVKVYPAAEAAVAEREFELQHRAHAAGVPTVQPIHVCADAKHAYLVLPFLPCLPFADDEAYGTEDYTALRPDVQAQVHAILETLYDVGIVYPDRTAYNFVLSPPGEEGSIFLLDFEHARDAGPGPVPAEERAPPGWNDEFK